MDRIDAMQAFVTVADLRGFAPAARQLKLSASAITRLVAALEARLSIRLLQRTTRSVTLTDAGARYLERARRILADVTETENLARAERTEPTGHFVVAAPSVFGRRVVGPVMSSFLARYPAVTGELALADRMVNLVEEGVDVAVRIGALDDSSLIARRVGATRRVVVAAPAYLATRKRLRTPDDLAAHAIIQFTGLGAAWRFRDQLLALAPRFVTNSADAAIAHAERGGGLTMVLAYQVREAVQVGRLAIVLPKFEPPPLPIQLVHPTTRLLSANVRTFVELVVETCAWQFVEL
ncbi:MAG: LysR family transcriptional regulator [Deltaproteobacteria bacterium]|nr:LysR family transcriptional regulator [Deltaproteobacteria bacterium]